MEKKKNFWKCLSSSKGKIPLFCIILNNFLYNRIKRSDKYHPCCHFPCVILPCIQILLDFLLLLFHFHSLGVHSFFSVLFFFFPPPPFSLSCILFSRTWSFDTRHLCTASCPAFRFEILLLGARFSGEGRMSTLKRSANCRSRIIKESSFFSRVF